MFGSLAIFTVISCTYAYCVDVEVGDDDCLPVELHGVSDDKLDRAVKAWRYAVLSKMQTVGKEGDKVQAKGGRRARASKRACSPLRPREPAALQAGKTDERQLDKKQKATETAGDSSCPSVTSSAVNAKQLGMVQSLWRQNSAVSDLWSISSFSAGDGGSGLSDAKGEGEEGEVREGEDWPRSSRISSSSSSSSSSISSPGADGEEAAVPSTAAKLSKGEAERRAGGGRRGTAAAVKAMAGRCGEREGRVGGGVSGAVRAPPSAPSKRSVRAVPSLKQRVTSLQLDEKARQRVPEAVRAPPAIRGVVTRAPATTAAATTAAAASSVCARDPTWASATAVRDARQGQGQGRQQMAHRASSSPCQGGSTRVVHGSRSPELLATAAQAAKVASI